MARGPGYPYINLEDAVGLAKKLYDFAKRTPANSLTVLKDTWGYSPTSSSAVKIIAAMSYFGLVEVVSSSSENKVQSLRITDRAYRILVDMAESEERQQAIRDAFLAPKAYKLCWDTWGNEPPPSMRSVLLFTHNFIESTVDQFIANYKKSLTFANMGRIDAIKSSPNEDESAQNSVGFGGNKAADDLDSASASVVFNVAPIARHQTNNAPANLQGVTGMKQEVFTLAEGNVIISWPEHISPESFEDFNDWISILLRKVKRNTQFNENKGS